MFFWKKDRIAILELSGSIGGAVRPGALVPLLRAIEKNRKIRGLVLDIDSPGGSATASEELYRAVQRVARVKPVTAYIRGMGASGAYYIACAAPRIVVLPNAMVGSIGVIISRPVLAPLMEKVGISVGVYKSGPYKDMTSFWRTATPEEDRRFESLISDTFERFVEIVAQGRKVEVAKAREWATGEIFSARRGLSLGLVDELGDMEDVLDTMTKQLGIKRRLSYARQRRPLFRRLFGSMAQEFVGTVAETVEARMQGQVMYR